VQQPALEESLIPTMKVDLQTVWATQTNLGGVRATAAKRVETSVQIYRRELAMVF
jgi:hypothetical protein